MAKFPLYQWKKAGGGSSSIDTSNFASKIKANTFTNKNIFENTGSVVSIKTTDDQSFGIEFKDNSNDMVGFVGTNTNDNEQKIILSGELGLQLRTPNKDINVNSGTGQLLYNGTSTAKNRREVLCRNDLYYIRKVNHTSNITLAANGYETAEYTMTGLSTGLIELYIVLTTTAVDIGFEVKIQCNNLNYKNLSDIKTISTSNWISEDLDQNGLVQIGFVIHGNNKIRFRMKNLGSSQIVFNGFRVYHRIPGKIVNS